MKIKYIDCGDMQSMLAAAQNPQDKDSGLQHTRSNPKAFYGVPFDEAFNLVKFGWDEGRKKMDATLTDMSIDEMVRQTKNKIIYDVVGNTPDIGRFLSGDPECMMRTVKRPAMVRRHTVRLQTDIAYPARTTTEEIFYRGAFIAALIHIFEVSGWAIEWHGSITTGKWESVGCLHWLMKPANERLNMDFLAFMLCHPSALRRVGFGLMDAQSTPTRKKFDWHQGGAYGIPQSARLPDVDYFMHMQTTIKNLEHAKSEAIRIATEIMKGTYKE